MSLLDCGGGVTYPGVIDDASSRVQHAVFVSALILAPFPMPTIPTPPSCLVEPRFSGSL